MPAGNTWIPESPKQWCLYCAHLDYNSLHFYCFFMHYLFSPMVYSCIISLRNIEPKCNLSKKLSWSAFHFSYHTRKNYTSVRQQIADIYVIYLELKLLCTRFSLIFIRLVTSLHSRLWLSESYCKTLKLLILINNLHCALPEIAYWLVR